MAVDVVRAEAAVRELIIAIGENPDREGLANTPGRVARFWKEFIDYPYGKLKTTFQSIHEDQIVIVSGIREWSICEHHMLPMLLDISVGYQTDKSILGLSKLVRVVQKWCHGLEIQERIADGILNDIKGISGTEHAAVYARGTHLCMVLRGVKSGALAVTSATSGMFKEDESVRREFLELARWRGGVWPE